MISFCSWFPQFLRGYNVSRYQKVIGANCIRMGPPRKRGHSEGYRCGSTRLQGWPLCTPKFARALVSAESFWIFEKNGAGHGVFTTGFAPRIYNPISRRFR